MTGWLGIKKKRQTDVSRGKLGMDASPNANGGTNGQKISEERNADIWKKLCQKLSTSPNGNGAKLIEIIYRL